MFYSYTVDSDHLAPNIENYNGVEWDNSNFWVLKCDRVYQMSKSIFCRYMHIFRMFQPIAQISEL